MKLKKNIIVRYSVENGDFWYDLTEGGYLNPEHFLSTKDTKAVDAAISIIREFESLLVDLEQEEEDGDD